MAQMVCEHEEKYTISERKPKDESKKRTPANESAMIVSTICASLGLPTGPDASCVIPSNSNLDQLWRDLAGGGKVEVGSFPGSLSMSEMRRLEMENPRPVPLYSCELVTNRLT